jgi:hypothetical protein
VAHYTDPVSVLVAAQANRFLANASPLDVADLESMTRLGLTQDRDDWAVLRFHPLEDGRGIRFDLWIDQLRAERAKAVGLVDRQELGLTGPRPGVMTGLPDALADAFNATSRLALAVHARKSIEVYFGRAIFPRPSLVGLRDLLDFIDGQAKRQAMKDALLWQNEHNLHFVEGSDWAAFIASIDDSRIDDLFMAWNHSLNNTAFSDDIREAWYTIESSKPNPRKAPTIDFRRFATVDQAPRGNLDARRRSLRDALDAARKFADARGASNWATHFGDCLGVLKGPPAPGHPMTKVLATLQPDAITLLVAALSADVFGGMGSWNDVPFHAEPEYRAVSDRLHAELLPAVIAAVNSGF